MEVCDKKTLKSYIGQYKFKERTGILLRTETVVNANNKRIYPKLERITIVMRKRRLICDHVVRMNNQRDTLRVFNTVGRENPTRAK